MGMFDNYKNIDNSSQPDNRHLFCQIDKTDEIIISGTNDHIFKLFFDYRTMCRAADWFLITYQQSISDPIMYYDIQSPEVSYKVENGNTFITVHITSEVSKLFDKNRITFAQIKLYMKDDSIIYGEKNQIRVIDTLDMGE